ncbi:MAG: hypothetical protein NT034_03095 [Candidatus Magasanikbacteria bacterium]|nr:hypothetical protein [Candidatus Magasanikbacteria bacterium]
MSYKRQLQAHYHNFINAVRTTEVPAWISGRGMRSTLLLSVVFLSGAYMVRINSVSASGYEIHNLEKQVSEMDNQVQDLQIKIADAGSMNNIEKRLPDLNLVAVGKVQRLTTAGAVAIAR